MNSPSAARTPALREADLSAHRALSAPIARITEESELFSELHANRYRFIAYFGDKGASAFEEIRAIHAEVVGAAGQLVRDDAGPGAAAGPRNETWEGAIGWGPRKDDRIPKRVDDAVRQIEQICLPLIQEGADLHRPRRSNADR